jgi:MSHA pilin protein MshA
LIELIIVIVLIGILAAVALPKYVSMQTQARIASLNALAGALRGASSLAYQSALSTGQIGATGSVIMGKGTTVNLVYGNPAAATGGINNAVDLSSDYVFSTGAASSTFSLQTSCLVTYTQATSTTDSTVVTTTSGC